MKKTITRRLAAAVLGAKARRGQHIGQHGHLLRLQSRLLAQLADGALQHILARMIELAGGNLQRDAIHADAMLPDQQRGAILIHRHDGRRTIVHDDLARSRMSVGTGDLPLLHIENLTLINALFFKGNFPEFAVIHELTSPSDLYISVNIGTKFNFIIRPFREESLPVFRLIYVNGVRTVLFSRMQAHSAGKKRRKVDKEKRLVLQ